MPYPVIGFIVGGLLLYVSLLLFTLATRARIRLYTYNILAALHELDRAAMIVRLRAFEQAGSAARHCWRTQIEVDRVDWANWRAAVWIAGWPGNGALVTWIPLYRIPPKLHGQLCLGKVMHAKVNTSARSSDELVILDWETT